LFPILAKEEVRPVLRRDNGGDHTRYEEDTIWYSHLGSSFRKDSNATRPIPAPVSERW
jgi:hypothetical protein